MLVSKEFTFDSAHFLTDYKGKCERLHGHTYKLRVTVEGEIGSNGLVMDFVDLKGLVKERILEKYDHQNLNDFFENPSAENMAVKFWEELSGGLPGSVKLWEIRLWETPNSFVTYHGSPPQKGPQ
ncbi:6-carboxytetrahydropterin synthase QueD [Patescibacteria group bacterium]|nr:6-carboxytetrahydropterin synthase QueD [Patescibacteria group bacterium]